ncbi:MAG: fibronectin type III domain-containing protein [Bacteroidia bacterium]|nr:fibronectin type III domain-containing protein [Bacteroidia bacterium]
MKTHYTLSIYLLLTCITCLMACPVMMAQNPQPLCLNGPNAPAPPSDIFAYEIFSQVVELSWLDNSERETGFLIRRINLNELPRIEDKFDTVEANEGSGEYIFYLDFDLLPSTEYAYEVRALGEKENSCPVVTTLLISTEANVDVQVPDPPRNFTASRVSDEAILLRWQDESFNERGFEIYRTLDFINYDIIATLEPNTQFYLDTNQVQGNTIYYYYIFAFNDNGYSDISNLAIAEARAVPAPPSNLQVRNRRERTITLSWQDNSTDELGFIMEVSEVFSEEADIFGDDFGTFVLELSPDTDSLVIDESLFDLNPNQPYRFG